MKRPYLWLITAYFVGRISTMVSPVGEAPWSCVARLTRSALGTPAGAAQQ